MGLKWVNVRCFIEIDNKVTLPTLFEKQYGSEIML